MKHIDIHAKLEYKLAILEQLRPQETQEIRDRFDLLHLRTLSRNEERISDIDCTNFIFAENLIDFFKKQLEKIKLTAENEHLIDEFNSVELSVKQKSTIQTCIYGHQMIPHKSEMRMICPQCGNTETIYTTTEDVKKTSNSNRKTVQTFINSLFAKQAKTIPPEIINFLKEKMEKQKISRSSMTCEKIRSLLKGSDLKFKTKYNMDTVLIRKILTNIEPPQPTDEEYDKIHNYMLLAITAFNAIKSKDDTNMRFYFYFLYKIIENVYRPANSTDVETREKRDRILENIHMQSETTIKKNDKYWNEICKYLKGYGIFKYTSTIT